MRFCWYCGGDADEPDHGQHCDGQQGRIEANEPFVFDFDPLGTNPPDTGAHRRARHTDPETSHEAARPDRARDRDRALAALRRAPNGLTDFELAAILGRQQTSAGKRRGELRDAGLVVDSGARRPAPSGSNAIVWCAVRR